jgi:SAM-dependent methyltransferase
MPGLDESSARRYRQRLQAIRKEMRKLSADFSIGKSSEARYADAYFLYNFPMNLVKTAVVTQEIQSRYPQLPADREQLDVLDVGCGSGAGIFGLYHRLSQMSGIRQFKFTGIDSSHRMLAHARTLSRWFALRDRRVRVRFLERKIEDLYSLSSKKNYDLILCVNSLAEIAEDDNILLRFFNSALRRLKDGGLLVVIEPALKKFSRRLMALHDRLISEKRIQILLPCLHDKPCALLRLENRTEWCHQTVSWSPPGFLRMINRGINREIDVLKFSYLVIVKSTERLRRPRGDLVISHLLKEKGKQRCYVCTDTGRAEVVRLDRAVSDKNARFADIRKGVIVKLADITRKKKDYWQVTENSTVEIVQ